MAVVLITWSPPTKDGGVAIDGYLISNISSVGLVNVAGDENYYVLEDVEPGMEYKLMIFAVNCVGESPGLLTVM